MPTVNVKIADIKDPVVVKVSEMGYIRGKDGFSPTVETVKIEGTTGGIVIEDGAGNKWCFLPGTGSDGDVIIEDDSGNQWHMPAGEAESGEIAAQDGDGGAWHLPVGSDGSGYRITITDKDGEHVAYVWDGERGADGRQGVDGQPGQDGQDGFSPLVSMTEITGGYRLTITDKTGAHSVNIYNGEESVIFIAEYGETTQEELDAAYSAGKLLFAHHDLDYLPLSKASYIEVSGERRWMYAFSGYSFGFKAFMTALKGYGSGWTYREQTIALADDLNTFVATYGETTQIQLDSAYSEGKLIFVKKDGLCRLLTSTSLYQPTPTAEGIRNYTFALYRPDIKQVETVYWLADGRGWTATTASADWQPKITASGILKGDGNGGVSAATAGTDYLAPSANAGAHNSIYRGKYLGSTVTAAQYAAISAGTFDDLYIGDYWTIGGVNYRVAAFDYWLMTGNDKCTTHHIVIVPDTSLYEAKMNTGDVVTGAYIGSQMYTTNLAQAKTIVGNAFGSAHILNHREYLKNAVNGAYESAGAWYDSTVELMSEQMVYGGVFFANSMQGENFADKYTIDKSQLPLFGLEHNRIAIENWWWLRDVATSGKFSFVNFTGIAHAGNSSNSYGVRPAFGIKA